ncbi:hypothetical protein GRI47_07625 [Erythrobacter pelagi]|uniref:TonB-dependent receptor n=1 Tax=Qipengyuania pelagi TaxID=994320 RepID=A0A844Y7R9_9SPHN|nr:hypothetical protein [Qipengyuania pelagi]MXO53876.1 hypothetical protein [Qipengyuania pelagi]
MQSSTYASTLALAAAFMAAMGPQPLLAQDAAPPENEEADRAEGQIDIDPENLIVVTAPRLRGQLDVEQPPIAEFNAEDIAAFGAGSIADVLEAIAPATQSGARGGRGGGRPVFLVNGIRVSSPREFSNYPPEAIEKVEVFPEEVAQRFGYSADQRVVNIILKNNFQAVTAEVEYEQPDRGGFSRNEQEATYLRIGEKGRLNFNVEIEDTSLLTEGERGLTIAGSEDEAFFRSLIADSMSAEATANYVRAFMDSGASLSLNGAYNHSESLSLSGLVPGTIDPIERRSNTDTGSFGTTLSGVLGDWRSTFTADAVVADTQTEIDRRDGTGFDVANSRTWSFVNKATFIGNPLELPAGEVTTTLDLGFDWKRIESSDTRADSDLGLTRRRLNGGVNLSVPIAERGGFLGAIGGLSANLTAGIEDLSDFGALTNWSAGLTWAPFDNLTLSATRINREVAPTLTELGSPRIDEFNVPVFDYARGNTEFVTLITGGNPNLRAETQADWKFSANYELPFWENTRVSVDYGINRSDDVTATPGFGAAFEQAFPDRVQRDAAGTLLAIDRRPLTLFETRSRVLSFGINTRGEIGKAPEPREERGGPPAAAGAASGQGGGQARGQSGGQNGVQGGAVMMMDPARMEAIRAAFCNAPEGEMPDLSQIPEQFRDRLMDADGNPDPEKIAQARARFCGEQASQDSERFAAMRTAICADPPNLDGLPEAMLARLENEAGEIDPEKLAAVRARMCSADGALGAGQNAGEASSQPAARRGGGRRGMFGGNPEDTRARYFLSLNHNITLENEVLLSQNGPLFDQLDGDVLSGGAIPQHTARLEGGIFKQGYGMRLSGNYIGEARLNGSGLPGSSDLFYGDLATVDIRLFADLGQVLKKDDGWFDGLRVSFRVDNVFDSRRRVEDEDGVVPDAFQPFRIDPTGRYIGVDLRKAF